MLGPLFLWTLRHVNVNQNLNEDVNVKNIKKMQNHLANWQAKLNTIDWHHQHTYPYPQTSSFEMPFVQPGEEYDTDRDYDAVDDYADAGEEFVTICLY